ncbi:carbohydrate ABC transporter permease [Metabacillus sediminilitoris]|uniref:Sugar ABC transporter permease n=1 Tax=Metabacillus sediminilitoris TaxID=2567941 RepID=A0A4S4BR59_9BACI|nr:sugar ABC transporter permease [Metabacillus sediminilitoris]QGQ46478.1 ABC transporter permease subunit [Metabacillus sediminilitoris]THF77465.1 sugar ABC transporter permease [Metabacillus sediminilitoris]
MKKSGNTLKENLSAYAFLSPWIIGVILFTGGPIIVSFLLSLTKWNLLGQPEFVGLENYKFMFSGESDFANSLKVTILYTVISVCSSVIMSLFLAVLLNFKVKYISLFQFFYFIPAVMPSVVMAFVFKLMFNKELGIVNYMLTFIGIDNPPNWLSDNFWIWPTLAVASIFTYATGQMMLIFNSSLKEVPKELYEACDIEGANFLQRFFHVTLPSISPIILFNTVVATINSFNSSFTLIYPLTGGGPGNATQVLSLSIYENAFKLFDMGYASALAVVLFVIVGIITAFQFRLSKNWVHYD